MSQYQTYQSFSLPNQLVRLQTQWAGMKANQVYGTTQGRLFQTPIANGTISSIQESYNAVLSVTFPAPPCFVVFDIYLTINNERIHYRPGIWREMGIEKLAFPYIGVLDPSPRPDSNLLRWGGLSYIGGSPRMTYPFSYELYLVSNVQPGKIEEQ